MFPLSFIFPFSGSLEHLVSLVSSDTVVTGMVNRCIYPLPPVVLSSPGDERKHGLSSNPERVWKSREACSSRRHGKRAGGGGGEKMGGVPDFVFKFTADPLKTNAKCF